MGANWGFMTSFLFKEKHCSGGACPQLPLPLGSHRPGLCPDCSLPSCHCRVPELSTLPAGWKGQGSVHRPGGIGRVVRMTGGRHGDLPSPMGHAVRPGHSGPGPRGRHAGRTWHRERGWHRASLWVPVVSMQPTDVIVTNYMAPPASGCFCIFRKLRIHFTFLKGYNNKKEKCMMDGDGLAGKAWMSAYHLHRTFADSWLGGDMGSRLGRRWTVTLSEGLMDQLSSCPRLAVLYAPIRVPVFRLCVVWNS